MRLCLIDEHHMAYIIVWRISRRPSYKPTAKRATRRTGCSEHHEPGEIGRSANRIKASMATRIYHWEPTGECVARRG